MHEVQKYLTVTNHGYIGYAVIANKKFWDGLPPDVRTLLEGAMRDATQYGNAISQQENDDAMEKMKASGKIEIVDAHRRREGCLAQGIAAGAEGSGAARR